MKIAFLSSYAHFVLDESSSKTSGGAELQVALLAKELSKRGVETTLLSGDTGQPDLVIFHGVRTRNAGKFHTGNLQEMLASIPRVLSLIKEERPDWVFVLGWTAWLFVLWAARAHLHFKLGFICGLDTEVNGEFVRANPLRGRMFDFALRRCDTRFAMTRLQESLFRSNGMSCSLYRNLILPRQSPPIQKKSVDFLWVARCQPIKRPALFLDLADRLPHAKFEMVCPPENLALFSEIEKRALATPNLTFHKSVPYHAIQARYDDARIFVNTSEWEGWANSFIQSGQGSTAILSLSVRPDTLFDDYALGSCADNDKNHFFSLAEKMFSSPGETSLMGTESARFVRELHDNEKETSAFLDGLRSRS